ncbi:hypothetical protein K435DRAFT_965287 [Dendrothele bispora CBS 962.96]|uniref:Uncharacterized protein n=1 Tax=Dendrothele bispora (strain CBS 962.96) TaxID=1314807 RepID=A0A4S8M7F7_DENBC|nr:hypothetical protein K435DRAFT_965287 [Dendrothele bispora CBS 962.96]
MSNSKAFAFITLFIIAFFSAFYTLCRLAMVISAFFEGTSRTDAVKQNHSGLAKSQALSRLYPRIKHSIAPSIAQDCHCSFCSFHLRRSPNHRSHNLVDFFSVGSLCPQPVVPSSPLRTSSYPSEGPKKQSAPCISHSQTLKLLLSGPDSILVTSRSFHLSQQLITRFARQNVLIKARTDPLYVSNCCNNLTTGFYSAYMLISPSTFDQEHEEHIPERTDTFYEERIKQGSILESMESEPMFYDGGYKMGVRRSAFLRLKAASSDVYSLHSSTSVTDSIASSEYAPAEMEAISLKAYQQIQGKHNVNRKILKKIENERVRTTRKKLFAKNLGVGKENATPTIVPVPIPGPFLSSTAVWTNSVA